jgi:GTP cyclohydrolase I
LETVMPNEGWNSDPHLARTPERFAKMLRDLTKPDEFEFTTFPADGIDEMVVVSNIPFYTLCAHHVIPFFGTAAIAYIPKNEIVGLSKLARTVQHFSKGLNVQEGLTHLIASYINDKLDPVGTAVVMRAEHLCMTMRGAQVPGAKTTTSAMLGAFADHDKQARSEFLSLVRGEWTT